MTVSRRLFLAGSSATGLTLAFAGCSPRAVPPQAGGDLNMWVTIAPNDTIVLRVNATDIGQGAQTGLAQIVTDEMDADLGKVRVEMAPATDRYMVKGGDPKGYYTGGSSSIREQFDMFANAGATARAMLIAAAAQDWGVDGAACTARNGFVIAPDGRRAAFGTLAAAAARRPVPAHVPRKTFEQRTLIGKPVKRLDIPDKVRGAAVYGIDVKVDGMLIGTIAQCPWFGGTLAAVDEKPALAVRGVKQVITLPNAVAVLASNFHAAKKGLEALDPKWQPPADRVASRETMYEALRKGIGAADSSTYTLDPDTKAATIARVEAALAAGRIFEAEYDVQLLAHAPMEPMNATARVTPDACDLWAPMQDQGSMLTDLAAALSLPRTAITLHSARCGGAFGRRLKTDYGVLAAQVARKAGAPVKLIWTREEDFTHDFYRPASAARLKARLRDDGTIAALDYSGATSNDTAVGGIGRNYPYGDVVIRQKNVTLQFPIGAWRSVDPSVTIFFIESFVDEIAHEAKLDPLDYRRRLLGDDARHLRVLDTVAKMANWGKAPPGRGQGLAFFNQRYWGTAVAQVVELSVDANNRITLHKVSCAIDPGLAINPDQVKAQAEGGIILGLSAALGEEITLKDGRVEQTNFDSYTVPRLRSIPEIDVTVLESENVPPGGCGEPPVPPIMPALVNAVFAATGKRIRSLPLARAAFTV